MSAIVSRFKESSQTNSMALIIIPVFILLFVGVINNNLSASGVQTTPIYATNASSPYPIGIVYPTTKVGCDAAISNCNFSAITTYSFLSNTSPFTQLIQGNLLGFFDCLISCPTSQSSNFIIALEHCTNFAGSAAKSQFIYSLYCETASFNGALAPKQNFFSPFNASSTIGNNSNWLVNPLPSTLNTVPSVYEYATYITNGSTFSNTYCDAIKICYSTPAFTCPTGITAPFDDFNIQYCLVTVIVNGGSGNTTFNNAFSFFGFLASIIMIFLGFGLTLAANILGTGTTIGINSQATRFCQVFGIGLLVWSVIYSEFGSWLNVLTLGLGTIAFVVFTMMYFVGLYWRVFSLE